MITEDLCLFIFVNLLNTELIKGQRFVFFFVFFFAIKKFINKIYHLYNVWPPLALNAAWHRILIELKIF